MRYANAAGRVGHLDIRHVLNGLADSYLYRSGRVDTTLPFDELRRRSLINEAAQAADGASDFSQRIRAALPRTSLTHLSRPVVSMPKASAFERIHFRSRRPLWAHTGRRVRLIQ